MEGGSENGDDYEALPPNLPASVHMVAGASAGILEHCIMYPVDCIKVKYYQLSWLYKHKTCLLKWALVWALTLLDS